MIPEYKLFHGAVLADIVDVAVRGITIDELTEAGRLTSYLLDGNVGLHIKHSSKRLPPWQFTLSRSNLEDCYILAEGLEHVYLAFVCNTDGIVILHLDEFQLLTREGDVEQLWIRITRQKRGLYTITGNADNRGIKKPRGVNEIVDQIQA